MGGVAEHDDAVGDILAGAGDVPTRDTAVVTTGFTRSARHLPLVIGLLLILALLGVGARQGGTAPTESGAVPAGKPAPDFKLTTYDGAGVRLDELRGRPVVLNFWASWCPPCREEAPALQRVAAAEAEAGRAAFVGVDIQDRAVVARRFLAEYAVTYPNGPDPADVEASYGAAGIPFTVFIAPDGTVARTWVGPLDEQRLVALIDEIAEHVPFTG